MAPSEDMDVVDHGGLRRVREELIREVRAALHSRVRSKWAKKDIQNQMGPLSLSGRIDIEEGPLDADGSLNGEKDEEELPSED